MSAEGENCERPTGGSSRRETGLPDWARGTSRGETWGGDVWVQRDMFDFRSHRELEAR